MPFMVRTQIQLTENQARRLRAIVREQGVSLAEVVRRCLDKMLMEKKSERSELFARAARLIGRFEDSQGATDLATDHELQRV